MNAGLFFAGVAAVVLGIVTLPTEINAPPLLTLWEILLIGFIVVFAVVMIIVVLIMRRRQ